MDVLTLNLALQKLQVNKATKEGQLPLPASNYQCISEMTDWISSARQYVQPDDLMEEKPAILADGDRSLSGCVCSAVASHLTSSPSSRSSLHIPPQSDSLLCLTSSRNSDGTGPQTPVSRTDFSILEEGRIDGSQSPTSSLLLSSEEELSGVDWVHRSGRSGVSGTSDDEVCDFMTHVRPSAFGVLSADFSRCPVEVSCRLGPRNIQASKMSGYAPAKKKALSMSCDSTSVIVRPNLDFDKMRKTCYGRRHARNDIKKPKMIRVRSFRDSVHCTLQSQFSPSAAAFGLLSRRAGFSPVISVESHG